VAGHIHRIDMSMACERIYLQIPKLCTHAHAMDEDQGPAAAALDIGGSMSGILTFENWELFGCRRHRLSFVRK
jgi:hypothetical protein